MDLLRIFGDISLWNNDDLSDIKLYYTSIYRPWIKLHSSRTASISCGNQTKIIDIYYEWKKLCIFTFLKNKVIMNRIDSVLLWNELPVMINTIT